MLQQEYSANVLLTCFDGELRQALNNLVGNAIDAMRGGGWLRVRVRRATDALSGFGGVRVTIADTGCGISKATQEKIFEPFFTTKGALGTGLGLWITLDLVTKEGGRLRVRSREHVADSSSSPQRHGTVFTVFLRDPV